MPNQEPKHTPLKPWIYQKMEGEYGYVFYRIFVPTDLVRDAHDFIDLKREEDAKQLCNSVNEREELLEALRATLPLVAQATGNGPDAYVKDLVMKALARAGKA